MTRITTPLAETPHTSRAKELAVLDRRGIIRQISEDRIANDGWIEAFQEDFNPKQR
jgi:hypothetical protein